MKFLREDQTTAVRVIAERIGAALETNQKVLWLTSGGSNNGAQVETMRILRAQHEYELANLTILPIDERYGMSGHADSNAQTLREAGFDPGAATWVDVLVRNLPFAETVDHYSDVAATAFAEAQFVIGQFGMGPDAHIAGLLPYSPAITDDSATVVGYSWTDYIRMTLSASMLKQINTSYVLAYGDSKKEALERLRQNSETFAALPAKLLYDLSDVYVYNDQLESEE